MRWEPLEAFEQRSDRNSHFSKGSGFKRLLVLRMSYRKTNTEAGEMMEAKPDGDDGVLEAKWEPREWGESLASGYLRRVHGIC